MRATAGALLLALCVVASAAEDYLTDDLRTRVEALKVEVEQVPSNRANAQMRARTFWEWINAYSLAGRYVPVNATAVASGVLAYPDRAGRIGGLDEAIAELALLDDEPTAIGALVADTGPFEVGSYATIRQTYTVGSKDIEPGGGFVVARHFMTGLRLQTDDEGDDDYVSISTSDANVRFSKTTLPMRGMHGGFRTASDTLMFRVTSGRLSAGDTVTVTYGDTVGGGQGLRMPSFSSDRMPLPLYVAFDGAGTLVSLPIQPIVVTGGAVAGVHGFAPSIIAVGEPFTLAVRARDRFHNRASGRVPAWRISVDGEPLATTAAGGDAIALIADISFDSPGVKRFAIHSEDGNIAGVANPVLVEASPNRRIYWGDTHGHSGFAEGVGTPDRFMVWAREDAHLDFVTHSEHDIWMDDFEWQVLIDNVRRYSEEGEFIAFLGYEWTIQNIQGGHHNVLFRTADGRRRIPAQEFGTLSLLYQGLRKHHDPNDVVVIPHAHQAGDYRSSDPLLQPLVEIMSQHGTFEWFGRMYLRQGHQVGFTAASDNHLSQPGYGAPLGGSLSQRGGLGALRATAKTRDALFDAMKNLATYATSGERMILDVTVNDAPMGARTEFSTSRRIEGRVVGTAPIDTITVVKDDEEIWHREYSSAADGRVADGDFLLVFESGSRPFHRGDNPRGWRWWRGDISVEGAVVVAVRGLDFHNVNTQTLDLTDGAGIAFSTHTRGDASTLALTLADVRRGAKLTVKLREGREFGGAPPRYRPHRTVPAAETVLPLRELERGEVRGEIPFDGYADAVTLRRIVKAGDMDISFVVEDEGERQGDYYYVRVKQVDDAIAWSSPIWVGGFAPR